ncbi:hypothetical protein SAMN05421841_0139 [Chryseobacterium wanjuense]|uniref:GIY-YIG domain-containing protein n=1 Tax=Chryseobacterium wanjuense TaxID=356305 RepID=A0A1I0MQI8_9FLAO|nr:hypothetical protein [Chryseobacterium wanjuense]SEV90827.1 hypothetical protein SAMN05421841_0139 [Chryseobacterium wanjuense]
MNDTIFYKIQNAYMIPYSEAIDEKIMDTYDKTNETIASSRIYLICRLRVKGFFLKKFSKPEVLYVGETFDKKNRFSPHKKLLKATTLLKSKDHLVVYFLHIRFSYLGLNEFHNNPLNIFNELKDIHSKTSVWLLERLFIKLFNPILNNKHNDENIKEDNLVRKKLIDNSILYVNLDIGMNELLFNFTGGRRVENQDIYNFNLKNNEMTFGHPLIE